MSLGLGPDVLLSTELLDELGGTDQLGEAKLSEEGLTLAGYMAGSVGISWDELARVIAHPYAQQKLEEAVSDRDIGG